MPCRKGRRELGEEMPAHVAGSRASCSWAEEARLLLQTRIQTEESSSSGGSSAGDECASADCSETDLPVAC
jgi:hypothetical protein